MEHGLDLLRRPIVQREVGVTGQALVELMGPIALEVDRVDQEHDEIAGDGLLDDVRDLAIGGVVDPIVDPIGGAGVVEIQSGDFRIEVLPIDVEKRLLELHRVAVPDRVGELELHAWVEVEKEGDQVAIGLVDLSDRHVLQLEGLGHGRLRFTVGTVVGHAQGHRDAEWRDEQVHVWVSSVDLPEQLQGETIVDLDESEFRRG